MSTKELLKDVVAKKVNWRRGMARLSAAEKFQIADQLYYEAIKFRDARRYAKRKAA
jgi:hypothetical protein